MIDCAAQVTRRCRYAAAVVSEVFSFKSEVLDLDGLSLHYLDEGSGEPVLMLHGNPTWSFYYRHLVAELRSTHRVVAPDHIGCGRSDKPGDDAYEYTLARRVADVGRLVDHLRLERLTLVVHDWGGMIGMAWAAEHPQLVARLVVMNTAAFPPPQGARIPLGIRLARIPGFGALLVRGLGAYSRVANRRCVSRPMAPDVARAYLEPFDSWAHRIAVHRFVQDLPLREGHPSRALLDATDRGLCRLGDIPMLLCWGMRDFVFGEVWLDEWVRRFPRAEVHRLADAAHYVLEDAREAIVPLVRQFLERPLVRQFPE